MYWIHQLQPRNWSIRSVVAAVPIAGFFVFVAIVFVGLNIISQQLDRLEDQVKSSLTYQQSFLEMPRILDAIQSDLYKLTVLRMLGVNGPPITEAERNLIIQLRHLEHLEGQLDPRVESGGLEMTLDTLNDAIAQAQILIERSPNVGAVAVRGAERNFREAGTIAESMSTQVSALVIADFQQVRDKTAQITGTFFNVLALVGLFLCVCALAATRMISKPILALADTVAALDQGDLDIVIPATQRQDEIGKVATAIKSFKASLRDNKALQKERDYLTRNLERKVEERTNQLAIQTDRLATTQQQAERARKAMTEQLRTEFGQVINAASAGDLSQRVVTSFSDENLQSLAADINRLVRRVDKNVTAIGQAMRHMKNGEFGTADDHNFTGAFADIMTQIDETGLQILEQSNQLTHIALHDALTGLPNRRFLEDRLTAYTKLLKGGGLGVAVMHIDLDRFKEINDTLGHAAGDTVLVHAAKTLSHLAGNDDFVSRVGGDEFMMICPLAYDGDPAVERTRVTQLSEEIIKQFEVPVVMDNQEVRFGASIGVAFSAVDANELSSLIIDADMALYEAKEAGRGRAQVFSTTIASALTHQRTLRDELRAALEADQFVPYFQPKFYADSHALAGVEALVRWQHPQNGIMTPDRFLDAAEEIDIVKQIDQRILWKSVDLLNDLWVQHNVCIPELSVNVSQQRLYDADLLDSLEGLSPPFAVSFELLESIFFDNQDDRFHWMLDALRERGIGIQIDDFGSGRASISALINVSPDRLKIDRSLVQPLGENQSGRQLIKGIVDIARSMNIGVTAEGVESMTQADILRDLGCDILQGYVFARPIPADALLQNVWEKAG